MANSISLRVTAPGAREAKTDLDNLKTSSVGLGSTARTAIAGLGLAASAGFGLAARGALEAQDAQGKFMAATGESRAEAERFVTSMDGLAGSAGTVGMKFEDLAALGTAVEQQFGTTGQKTQDLTENIAEFARVTGGDANQAAHDIDDTLSAYGLTADDAAGFTDQLVASAQKYGTEVGPEQLDILRKISPALQTMGGDLNDAVGFLNAMETAGINASDAQKGFNTALSKLPPGTNIDDLVKHFADLKSQGIDPTKEAIGIFGVKAGPALLAAIQPGMNGLDDLAVSAEDAAGSVHKGAENMLTDADKIKGVAEKIVAGAREIGQDFGPALMGISSLGSLAVPLASGAKDVLAKALPLILPQAIATGTATGAAIAEGEAEGAAGASAIGKIGSRIAAMSIPLAASGTTVGTAVGGAMSLGMAAGFAAAGVGVIELAPILDHLTGQDTTSKLANAGKYAADIYAANYSDEIQSQYATVVQAAFDAAMRSGATDAAAALAGKNAGDAFLAAQSASIQDHAADDAREAMAQSGIATIFANDQALKRAGITAVETLGDAFANTPVWNEMMQTAHDEAEKATQQFELGWQAGVPGIHDQWKQFVHDMENGLDPAKEMAWLAGKLSSKRLADGLASNDPIIHAKAVEEQRILQEQWDKLYGLGYRAGEDGGQGVADGINNKISLAEAQAAALARRVNAALAAIDTNIQVHVGSDGEQYAHGHRAAGGPVKKGVPVIVGEKRPELFVPKEDGTILPEVPSMSHAQPWRTSGPPMQMPPPPIVNVMITARDVAVTNDHYRILQGGNARMR